MITVGAYLQQQRNSAGLTQEEVAGELGKESMKRLVRFGIAAIVSVIVVCVAIVAVTRNTPRVSPTVQPAARVEVDPTALPAPTAIPRGYVSKALLGGAWPLSIDEGTIVCDRTAILLRAPDGHLYAVNGTARSQVGHFGWLDIRAITLPDPNSAGLIMNVQPLVDHGLELCR